MSSRTLGAAKVAVWMACALPAALLLYRTFVTGDLGVNPVETLQHETGRPALQLLLATLAITPLRRLTGVNQLIRFRRMLGLWAFFYAVAHFGIYLTFDRLFSLAGVVEDTVLRRFVLAGMISLLAMLPLALTSTSGWIRRLGGKRWRQLHRLVYVAAIAGAVHFIWKEKVLTYETLSYFAAVALLLGYRVVEAMRRRRSGVVAAGARQGASAS
jgi:sulfoxide reductase heme-binding subunit YedZ